MGTYFVCDCVCWAFDCRWSSAEMHWPKMGLVGRYSGGMLAAAGPRVFEFARRIGNQCSTALTNSCADHKHDHQQGERVYLPGLPTRG